MIEPGREGSWLHRHRSGVQLTLNAVTSIVVILLLILFLVQNSQDVKRSAVANRALIRELHIEHKGLLKVIKCIVLIEPREGTSISKSLNLCIAGFRGVGSDRPEPQSSNGGNGGETSEPRAPPTTRPSPSPSPRPSPSPSPSPSPTTSPSPTITCLPDPVPGKPCV